MKLLFALLACLAVLLATPLRAAETEAEAAEKKAEDDRNRINLRGSVPVWLALKNAQPGLKKEFNINLGFVRDVSGLQMIDNLGMVANRQEVKGEFNDAGIFDVALFTRPMTGQELALRPERKFTQTLIGKQALVVVVPEKVWNNGVRALSKEQLRQIYEGEVTNWKKFGGEDRTIVYYNREADRGNWDLFMIYLYGDVRKAPNSTAETLNNATDVATAVEFNQASISLLEYGELKGTRLKALGLKLDDGTVVDPTAENIGSGAYKLSRPLYLITAKHPVGKMRSFLDYMVTPAGQEAVKKAGHVSLTEMGTLPTPQP